MFTRRTVSVSYKPIKTRLRSQGRMPNCQNVFTFYKMFIHGSLLLKSYKRGSCKVVHQNRTSDSHNKFYYININIKTYKYNKYNKNIFTPFNYLTAKYLQ